MQNVVRTKIEKICKFCGNREGIHNFLGNKWEYARCILGLWGMDAHAPLPFPLPSALPILFPFHMHLITHHTLLPSSTNTSRFPTFPSPTPSSRILSPLSPSATLSQHPSFLLPPPSPFLSLSPTRPHLSLSLPRSPDIPPPLLSPCVCSEV